MDKFHGRAEKLLAQNMGPSEQVLARVKGADDTQCLVLTGQRALIIKVGFRAGQTGGGKVTSFDYRNITAVEVRTSIMTGSFAIASGGVQGNERSYWGTSKSDAWHAPNAIPITKKQQPAFQQVANFIRERSRPSAQQEGDAAAPDIPDQIRKLADLRQQGILSDEEFEAKKSELLSRM
jgi:Short C-terminal domain